MPRPWSYVVGLTIILGVLALAGWGIARSIRRSEDPARTVFKWVLTFLFAAFLGYQIISESLASIGGVFILMGVIVTMAIILSIMWAPQIGEWFAKPITSLYDGGDAEWIPQPLYSMAIAKRKQGRIKEAAAEIHKQLARFPHDFTGQMLLAEILAEDAHDVAGARQVIEQLLAQPEHPPKNIAFACNTLADWILKFEGDLPAARAVLQSVIDRFPATELAQSAHDRISHLADRAAWQAVHERKSITLKPGVENIGLLDDSSHLQRPEEDPAETARRAVEHLNEYPQDIEARERLALLYAGHYQRPDLAIEQFEELIRQPGQTAKNTARWLNTIADLHVKHGGEEAAARRALERINELFPGQAVAETAQTRLAHLPLEFKGTKKSQAIKLGSYEQNIGLKKPQG